MHHFIFKAEKEKHQINLCISPLIIIILFSIIYFSMKNEKQEKKERRNSGKRFCHILGGDCVKKDNCNEWDLSAMAAMWLI